MASPEDQYQETDDLAMRFLKVLGALFKVASDRVPDDLVGQLNLNQLHTLHLLNQEPGMAQKDIAERLQITPAAISTAVRDMESLGLVERRPDSEDARQMRLYLCPFGQRIVDKARALRRDAVAGMLSALSPEEQRMIVEALERAVTAREKSQ